VRSPVCGSMLALNHGEGAMGQITRVPFPERAASPWKTGIWLSILCKVLLGERVERPVRAVTWITLGEGRGATVRSVTLG